MFRCDVAAYMAMLLFGFRGSAFVGLVVMLLCDELC
jgi:hypothetical protein